MVLEALAMQRPVIATDVGGTAEIIRSGHTGTLVRPNDEQQLASAISDFSERSEQYRKMAGLGRQVILDNFDHRQRVQRFEHLYESIVAGRGRV